MAIDYNFAEFLSDYLYAKNPIPRLELRSKSLAELNTEFSLQDINFTDSERDYTTCSQIHPESNAAGSARVQANVLR